MSAVSSTYHSSMSQPSSGEVISGRATGVCTMTDGAGDRSAPGLTALPGSAGPLALGLTMASTMAPSSAAMTSPTPAQRARPMPGPSSPGPGLRLPLERVRTVEAGFAVAIRRGGSAREVASSILTDCGTLEGNTSVGGHGEERVNPNERGVPSNRERGSRSTSIGSAPPRPPTGPIARVVSQMPRSMALATQLAAVRPPAPFGLPNLRRNVCPHFFVTGPRGPIPIQAPHMLKAYMRHARTVSRCQLRGGVHLDGGYVTDICLSSRFNQCVFYEDELTGR